MTKVLVTGYGGFVGSNLLERLLKYKQTVVGIDKAPRYQHKYPSKNFKHIVGNLNEIHLYKHAIKGAKKVYHLAASADIRRSGRDPWWDFEDNVKATVNLLEFMRKEDIPEIKFMSSSAVYGTYSDSAFTEESPFNPINLYGSSKVACEAYIKAFSDLYGIKYTIFRPAQIVGPYEHRGVIVDFFKKLIRDPSHLEILGDGNQIKSYFHVSDCVKALLILQNGIYNLANSDSISVKELAKVVIQELDLNPMITYTGGDRGWLGDTPFYYLSIDRALSSGWEPVYNCKQSIRKTIRWLNDKHSNTNKK